MDNPTCDFLLALTRNSYTKESRKAFTKSNLFYVDIVLFLLKLAQSILIRLKQNGSARIQ